MWVCWCPSCTELRPAQMLSHTGLVVCTTCGTAFTAAELQEAAYYEGFKDGSAEALAIVGRKPGPKGRRPKPSRMLTEWKSRSALGLSARPRVSPPSSEW